LNIQNYDLNHISLLQFQLPLQLDVKENQTKSNSMEKRRSERVNHKLEAKAIVGDKICDGIIENFSREGILKIISYEKTEELHPGMILVVNFQAPSGQELKLNCEIKWVSIKKDETHLLKNILGMEILNPPQVYTEFIQALYNESFYRNLVQRINLKNL
jgi:hypothetical protein